MKNENQDYEITINNESGSDYFWSNEEYPIQITTDNCVLTQTLKFNTEELIRLYLIIEALLTVNIAETKKHCSLTGEVYKYEQIKEYAEKVNDAIQYLQIEGKTIDFRKIIKPLLTTKIYEKPKL